MSAGLEARTRPLSGVREAFSPNPLDATEEFLKLPFREESKLKIMWDNPARLYGLG